MLVLCVIDHHEAYQGISGLSSCSLNLDHSLLPFSCVLVCDILNHKYMQVLMFMDNQRFIYSDCSLNGSFRPIIYHRLHMANQYHNCLKVSTTISCKAPFKTFS